MITVDRADESRSKGLWVFPLFALLSPLAALMVWRGSATPLAVLYLMTGAALVFLTVATAVRLCVVRSAHRLWRHRHGAVVFISLVVQILCDALSVLLVLGGCLGSIAMILLTEAGPTYAARGGTIGLALTLFSVALVTPLPLPRTPVIALTPQGVWLWPHNHHRTWIPWDEQPRLEGVSRIGGDANITTQYSRRTPVRFPMVYLPLGYNQLRRVLELFTTHPELRPALAHPEGLALVQALMHTPVYQIEERLAGEEQ